MHAIVLLFGLAPILVAAVPTTSSQTTSTSYTLAVDYTSTPYHFFSTENWEYFNASDPTHGAITYTDQIQSFESGLVRFASTNKDVGGETPNTPVYIGIDTDKVTALRNAVRLVSTRTYNPGFLLIANVHHVPSTCGAWPALWMTNNSPGVVWPNGGEIDIIENVNNAQTNAVSLHTGPNCAISSAKSNAFSGTVTSSNCDSKASLSNTGCSIKAPDNSNSFGSAFNAAGGGVYAAEWTKSGFNVWFWSAANAASYPPSLLTTSPKTSEFGKPLAQFAGSSCDYTKSFFDMSIIVNTALCGDWAGMPDVWKTSGCQAKTGKKTCAEFVATASSEDLKDAYWIIKNLRSFTTK